MAHARLIAPDISVTTFSFITIYCLCRVLNTGTMWAALCGGLSLGLALLCKFAALFLLPTVLSLALLWRFANGKTKWVTSQGVWSPASIPRR